MIEGTIETEVTLQVKVRYSYSYSPGVAQSLNDPGEPADEEVIIEYIDVLNSKNEIVGRLDTNWLSDVEEEAIKDMIVADATPE